MSAIRSKNTKPELVVRRVLHSAGFRYRLHSTSLPGTPDLVLPRYGAVVFVHGCFWHQHDCPAYKLPNARREFWEHKLGAASARDSRAKAELLATGWRVATVWECSLRGREKLPVETLKNALANWLRAGDQLLEVRGKPSS